MYLPEKCMCSVLSVVYCIQSVVPGPAEGKSIGDKKYQFKRGWNNVSGLPVLY
jgi:hypothetical protein